MKKTSIFMVAIIAIMASCTAQSPKATLKTDIDSLSYAIGMARTDGLLMYLLQQGVDTVMIDDFLRGFNDGINMTSPKDAAYLAGNQIGSVVGKSWVQALNQQIFGNDETQTIDKNNMIAGFIDGVKMDEAKMKMQFAQEYSQNNMERISAKAMAEKYADNKAIGEKFLADNKDEEGIKTTESGLQYRIITEGKGNIPSATSIVKVHYHGTLINGTVFDSSVDRGEPTTFNVNGVIPGWTEALQLMPVGSKWKLYIPQELAYGSKGSGGRIEPFSTLIFEVELLGIEN